MIRLFLCLGLLLICMDRASAQPIDLSHGGPVDVTASNGLEYDQSRMTITARGNARAVRGDVTVVADELVAHLRKKRGAAPDAKPALAPASPTDTGSNEIYRLEAMGNVHIFTPTDHLDGAEHGVYDIDQSVLIVTGPHLKLTSPQQIMTAKDAMEYWSARHMAVGRGNAVVITSDGRQIAGDTLVGYTNDNDNQPKPDHAASKAGASGKLKRADAFGHVLIRTATETVIGDRGVYVPDTGMARLAGHVHITRGLNQLNGAEALVNMKTGLSELIERPGARVEGLVVPNQNDHDPTSKEATASEKKAHKTP